MQVGIATEETWSFLHEIYDDLSAYHQTNLFKRRIFHLPIFNTRINRFLFRNDLATFLRGNDVVFFEWASELLAAATHLPKRCGIVTRLHRYEMYEWVDRINWDAVDRIILVSQAKKQEFLDRFPEQASKVVVIYEAVDPHKFQFKSRQFNGNIGILCHLTPRKRVYELILTFYELTRKRDGLHLHIGGGAHHKHGAYYQAMQDLIKNLGLQNKVTFYGHIKETWKWYQTIDIFISNAYSEGLQVAPLEAMACGCYCLVHRWAGAEDLLPEPYLYYTDGQLQEKILQHCDTPETAKREQQSYMRSVVCDKFNIHRTKVQVREVIEAAGGSIFSQSKSRLASVTIR